MNSTHNAHQATAVPPCDTDSSPALPVSSRPRRVRILDELARPRTLDSAPTNFLTVTGGALPPCPTAPAPLLLFGIGPDPEQLAAYIKRWQERACTPCPEDTPVYWIECPDFTAQLPAHWEERIPSHWIRLPVDLQVHAPTPEQSPEQSPEKTAEQTKTRRDLLDRVKATPSAHLWRYAPGVHLFSAFWGPLLGAAQAAGIGYTPAHEPARTVVLPGSTGDLLTLELEQAVAQSGFTPFRLTNTDNHAALLNLLRHDRPALFLSVNLRGLDADGETFRLLRACGVPVALWFVDNPWHILSSLRTPWWREAALFVTDASFITPLRQHGAGFVRHLPLGAWMQPACQNTVAVPPLHPVVFVGRAAFPAHDRFFAGCRIPENVLEERTHHLHTAAPPHVHWWEHHLGLDTFWPGKDIRQAGFGAECCSSQRRRDWLNTAAPLGLTVFGDATWKQALPPGSDVRPPLDYYGSLPTVYGAARYSLNVTSLLLPEGLTQRHFDVWTAGGFLFSDATPGLKLFPSELVEPIALTSPHDLRLRIIDIERDSLLRQHLIQGWKDCLCREHTYTVRFETLMHELVTHSAHGT